MKKTIWSSKLVRIRKQIDASDRQLLLCIAKRQKLISAVAAYKKRHGLPISDPIREQRMMKDRQTIGHLLGLDENMIQKLFDLIIKESKRIQKEQI